MGTRPEGGYGGYPIDALVSLRTVARRTETDARLWRGLVERGAIPAYRVGLGGPIRVRWADVERLVYSERVALADVEDGLGASR